MGHAAWTCQRAGGDVPAVFAAVIAPAAAGLRRNTVRLEMNLSLRTLNNISEVFRRFDRADVKLCTYELKKNT